MYKKDLHDQDNHDGVITPLEPDILECEVKWALESITTNKASGGDGIPVELFQILKDDAVTVLHSICQQTWKTQQWPKDWEMSVFIPIRKKSNAKECSDYCTIALISHASKNENENESCSVVSNSFLQATVLEWVAIPSSRGSSQPRDQTQVSHIAGRILPAEPAGKLKC